MSRFWQLFRPALAAGTDVNMAWKHGRSTTGIGYDARTATTGSHVQRHCWNMTCKHGRSTAGNRIRCTRAQHRHASAKGIAETWLVNMAQVLRAMGYYAATAPSNLDAAIIYNAISSADKSLSQPWCSHTNTIYNAQLQKTIVTIVLRMQPRHQATFMQPSQCILRHDVAGNTRWQQSCSHSNAICNHRFKKRIELTHIKTTPCRTQRRNRLRSERPQPQPPHTGGTFHRQLQPLYTEKRKVSCSGFLPNTSSMQHATFMQPTQCILQHDVANPHVSTHMATPDDNNHAAIRMRSATTDSRNE